MSEEKSKYYLERLSKVFLREPELVFENEEEVKKRINDKIVGFTDRLNNDYLVNGKLYYNGKEGILDDREYLEEFIGTFLEPHDYSITSICNWTLDVIPFVFYDLTYVEETKIERVIEQGYRLKNKSFWSRVDEWDIKPRNAIKSFGKYFEKYQKHDISGLKIIEDRLKDKIENLNKSIYCEIISLSNDISESDGIPFPDLARALFHWAFGMVLNYYQYDYRISRNLIGKIVGTKPDKIFQNPIERLNRVKESGNKFLLAQRIVRYLLECEENLQTPEIKDFIGKPPVNGLLLFSNNITSNKDKNDSSKGKKNGSLHEGDEWLDTLIEKIISIEHLTDEKVKNEIKKYFPDFEGVPDYPELSFTKGVDNKINKTSIDKAFTYLFNKHHKKKVDEGAIKKRYYNRHIW